jgi:hypothetical protein
MTLREIVQAVKKDYEELTKTEDTEDKCLDAEIRVFYSHENHKKEAFFDPAKVVLFERGEHPWNLFFALEINEETKEK